MKEEENIVRYNFSPSDLKEAMYDYLVKHKCIAEGDATLETHEHSATLVEVASYHDSGFRVQFWTSKKDKPVTPCTCKAKKK
jgi:hypothetical protein